MMAPGLKKQAHNLLRAALLEWEFDVMKERAQRVATAHHQRRLLRVAVGAMHYALVFARVKVRCRLQTF